MAKNININEIETLFELVIKRLKADKAYDFHFDDDEYWIITTDEWNNFETKPELSVGSLNEDVEFLKKAIEENEIFSYSNLDRLASVLRVISEKQAPIN